MKMSRQYRVLLLIIALLISAAAALALLYAFIPGEAQRLQATLVPTFFTPPPP
jgi:hypothetical protein